MSKQRVFYKVLDRFQFKLIDGKIVPTLIKGSVTDLVDLIFEEIDRVEVEELLKAIAETDPNEGDNGSHQDQAPEDFK